MFYSVVSQIINLFGVMANIVNIICFVKQGFQDHSNISLLGLAVSDLLSLTTLIWTNICFIPGFSDLDLSFDPVEVQYLTGSGPHVIFTRVTGCITAFITLERCLCVTIPLKALFTSQVVFTIVALIFVFVIANMVPVYFVTRIADTFSVSRNKTILGLVFTEYRDIVEAFVFAVSSCFIQLGAFIIVLVCTVTLVVKLRRTSQWRQSSTVGGPVDHSVIRDQKVTKMVVTISTLFIACFIPVCFIMVAMIMEPELCIGGRYRNFFIAIFSFCFVLESTNSAMNIFIYYQMSSKYRKTLLEIRICKCS